MRPHDPKVIHWAVGDPHRAHYGERTRRIEIVNSASATGRDRVYINHLLCRLEPYGILILSGKIDRNLHPRGFATEEHPM